MKVKGKNNTRKKLSRKRSNADSNQYFERKHLPLVVSATSVQAFKFSTPIVSCETTESKERKCLKN